ncbi:MAG: glycosyltransferase family 4 protein [Dokdonella sp.]|uniref:glycosyltransferase family 4 protein n=1 Tax=Dokdonella sp. TaxID=2291710 RepID=UPI003F7ED3FF
MTRIAIVVQRCDESVVGGSEALAWQYARLLSDRFEVEVLSSTAVDYVSWRDELPVGVHLRDGIPVRRFPVALERGPYWYGLHQRMMLEVQPFAAPRDGTPLAWREALQDEYVRFQGPCCPELDDWLRDRHHDYAAVLFCTYLYPTTYFGIAEVPPHKTLFVPTLHDEPTAYLPAFAQRYATHRNRIWLTAAEQRTAARVWGYDEGEVIGMAVEHSESATPASRARPYLLYCGRIEAGKGCDELVRAMGHVADRGLDLVLTGVDNMGLPRQPWIEYLGFVDERRKFELMAGATAFVLPSQYESFSIVTLEAMAQRAPVLVNGRCDVMREHIERSGAGFHYDGIDDMVAKIGRLAALDPGERARIGAAGREYVLANYREEHVRARLVGQVERVIGAAAG